MIPFFENLSTKRPDEEIAFFIVSHLLPDKLDFFDAISNIGHIAAIIPKQKSINYETLVKAQEKYPILMLNREEISNNHEATIDQLKTNLQYPDQGFVIMDIGGYFADILPKLKSNNLNLLGIVEDTENGHQKYADRISGTKFYSVARSPLKETEDFLVGHSIVFSAEAVLRQNQMLLNGMDVGVIGFGKIGKSIIGNLAARNIKTSIYDIDPIKRVQAKSFGYNVQPKENLLKQSDYIFCATGQKAISGSDYEDIKANACIISVTSSDDEFDLSYLKNNYYIEETKNDITAYFNDTKKINMINNGNAINFLHGAVVGNYIRLVQAEMLLCADEIVNNLGNISMINSLSDEKRKEIASNWEACYDKSPYYLG